MDKISVIIPVYNVEAHLPKCVESVIHQTYSNLEIILVNDGSTDDSGAICDSYAKKDARIRVIHKKNGGLSDARNCGIAEAKGEYLAFVDADDYIAPDMFRIMYERIKQDVSDMAVCSFLFVNEKGEALVSENEENPISDETVDRVGAVRKLEYVKKWYFSVAWNKLYSRCLFDDIKFPQGRFHEDEYIAHIIYHKCQKVSFISDTLYFYVQREGSITDTISLKHHLDEANAMLERAVFAMDKGYDALSRVSLDVMIHNIYECYGNKDDNRYGEEIKKLQKKCRKNTLQVLLSPLPITEKIRYMTFCINVKWLHNIHNNNIKRKKNRFYKKICKNINKIRKAGQNCIFLMATPVHGNLGDHAIVYAQKKLLQDLQLQDYLIEISMEEYKTYKEVLKERIQSSDMILLCGGGHLGTLWPAEDNVISEIVDTYRNNPIIVFPQTCFYDENDMAKQRMLRNRIIYSKAGKLKVFLRDQKSYKIFSSEFPMVQTCLVPDMVTYMTLKPSASRTGSCLVCMREDKESILSPTERKRLLALLKEKGYDVIICSTVEQYGIDKKTRESVLHKKWQQFAQARLVVTDRLHGMLFAAINQTPCLYMDNISGKVSGQAEWLKDLSYITAVKGAEELFDKIKEFESPDTGFEYSNQVLQPYYEILKKEIKDSYYSVR